MIWALILLLVAAFSYPAAWALASADNEGGVSASDLAQQTLPKQAAGGTPFTAPQQLHFRHITADDGLSSLRTSAVVQSRDGFMWFGTTNGLDRYDGYQIVAYRNDPSDPNSLSGNFINYLLEDHTGKLWVATTYGLDAFDPSTGRFTRYLNDPANPQSLSSNAVMYDYEDRNGIIWVCTTSGLNSLDPKTGRFTRYLNDPANPRSLSSDVVLVVYQDRAGVIWVGTDSGLDRLDGSTGGFTRFVNDPANPRSLSYNSVWDIFEDHAGVLWITTDGGGLNRLDRENGTFDHFRHDPNDPQSISADRLDCLFEDSSGKLWVGTFGGGLSILDQARQSFSVYQHDPADPASLAGNSVTDIHSDRSGIIWLATGGAGMDIYNPEQKAFTIYKNDSRNVGSLASSNITGAFEDRDGVTWVGTMDAGLDRVVPGGSAGTKGERIFHYPPDPTNPRELGNPFVKAFLQDRSGTVWVGTYGGGLYRFDPVTGTFTGYRHSTADPDSLSDDRIWGMVQDNAGQIWVATFGGLDRFDPANVRFSHYRNNPSDPNSISSNLIWAVTKDKDGNIWIGTRGSGVNRIEPTTSKVTRYRHDPNKLTSLGDDSVDAVLVDRSGILWVGIFGGGVDRFNASDGTFTHYRERDGLASDEVLSILEDGPANSPTGELWVVSGHALSVLGKDRKSFRTFDTSDGLPATQYTGAAFSTSSGQLLIGSQDGLIQFDPARLPIDSSIPPVAFTNFLLDNKEVPIAPHSPLSRSINQTSEVQIPYSDRIVSFEFSALSYSAPARNRYRYRLEGFDPDWTEVDSARRLVTYTNLNPGRYVFHITASNGDGIWNETGRSISLTITPPWWATTWFSILVVLVVAIGLFAAYWARVGGLERRRRTLEAAVANRTTELVSRTAELAQSNDALRTEISERESAERALDDANSSLRERVRELTALNAIGQTLTRVTDITAALEAVAVAIVGLFDAAVGIWQLDEPRLTLTRMVAAVGDTVTTEPDQVALGGDPVSQMLVAYPAVAVIGLSEPRAAIAQPPHLPIGENAGTYMLVPLRSHGEVVGIVCIRALSAAHSFTSAEVALARTMGAILTNAILNSRLFVQAQTAAAEEERRRIARELHDSVSQALYAANISAEVLPRLLDSDPSRVHELLGTLHRFTSAAAAEMRMLLVELRPAALVETPLHELLLPLVEATRARGAAMVEEYIDSAPRLSPEVQIAFYRIAQEALSNVATHADAHHVVVRLRFTPNVGEASEQPELAVWSGRVEMQIADNGRGFDPQHARRGRLGLGGMQERAAGIGAELDIKSGPGTGTQVSVIWPGHDTEPRSELPARAPAT